MKGLTARVFWDAGLRTIGAVAESDIEDILPLFVKVFPLFGPPVDKLGATIDKDKKS